MIPLSTARAPTTSTFPVYLVLPETLKFPLTCSVLRTVVVPVLAPILSAVARAPKLIVVGVSNR